MPVFQGELSSRFVSEHRRFVADVLENVFHKPNSKGLMDLQNKIYKLTPDVQAYFFHAEPLDVAADLAGIRDQTRRRPQTTSASPSGLRWTGAGPEFVSLLVEAE